MPPNDTNVSIDMYTDADFPRLTTTEDKLDLTKPAVSMTPDAALIGLTDTLTCKTPKETSNNVSSLIDKVNYEKNHDELMKKIVTYLTLVGVKYDDILVFMSELS